MTNLPAHQPVAAATLEEEALTIQLNSQIKRGDLPAVRLLAELRQRVARRNLLVVAPKSQEDVEKMQARVLEAVAKGDISPREADHLTVVLDNYGRAIERGDNERRLRYLEDVLRAQKERPA